MTRGAALVLAAAVTILTVVPVTEPSASAQAAGDGPLELTVTQLSGTLGPGSVRPPEPPPEDPRAVPDAPGDLQVRALVENVGDEELDGLRVIVEVHPAASSRGRLRADLRDGPTSNAIHIHPHDLRDGDALQPGDVAGVSVTIPREEVPWSITGGVHPVRIAVLRGAAVLAEVTTATVWLTVVPESPLLTTALWSIDAPPWRRPGPSYPAAVDGDVHAGSHISSLLRALELHPDAEVLPSPPAHLLEDLQDRADGFVRTQRADDGAVERRPVAPEDDAARQANDVLQRLRSVLTAAPAAPLPRPYADADLRALVGSEDARTLGGELASAGRTRLDTLGGRTSDQRAYLLPAGVDAAVLDLVPSDTVLVPYAAIEGPDPAADPTLPSPVRDARSASGRPVTLLVGDPYVTALLATPAPGGPVVASQRIVAETAMVFFEAPGASDRGLAIHPPDGWSPSAELAQRFLGQLEEATWLALSAPSTLATSARRGGSVRLRDGGPVALDDAQVTALSTTLGDLEAARATRVVDGATDLAGRSAGELRDTLLRATSRWFPAGSDETDALIEDVDGAISATLADVTIASGSLVTLTADTGTIPVTLQRGQGGPLAVQVEVASQARLTWPEGRRSAVLELEEGTTQTVTFPTRALSTGTFSVTVRVTDPTGRIELDRTTLSVRSTAISRRALAVVGGLVAVLLVAGLFRRRPRRRPRRQLEVVH